MAGRVKFVKWDLDNLVEQIKSVCILDGSGCWLWNYRGNTTEWYPEIMINRKREKVSRRILAATTGINGVVAMHKCDRPRCCNPDHLIWGSYQDNSIDSVNKGRNNPYRDSEVWARGEDHGLHKLSEVEVLEIRAKRSDGTSIYRLAIDYNVTKRTIQQIVRRKTWTHV